MESTIIKERVLAFTRLVLTIIAIANSCLVANGNSPIPCDEDSVIAWVTHGVDAIVLLYCSWWKNNNITKKAIKKAKGV